MCLGLYGYDFMFLPNLVPSVSHLTAIPGTLRPWVRGWFLQTFHHNLWPTLRRRKWSIGAPPPIPRDLYRWKFSSVFHTPNKKLAGIKDARVSPKHRATL